MTPLVRKFYKTSPLNVNIILDTVNHAGFFQTQNS